MLEEDVACGVLRIDSDPVFRDDRARRLALLELLRGELDHGGERRFLWHLHPARMRGRGWAWACGGARDRSGEEIQGKFIWTNLMYFCESGDPGWVVTL